MRYLITGGAGFIGSHLCDALVGRGHEVVVLDDLSTGRLENIEPLVESGAVEFIHGSMLDASLVDRSMSSVDRCFHLASAVGVQLIVSQPLESLLRNVRGNDIVLGAAARHSRWTLFTSTSEIFGKNSVPGLHENSDRILGSPFKSRWGYSTAKAFGEALVHNYFREQGAPMLAVRLFNTVGARQTGAYGMVLPRFVGQALSGDPLTVYGNGTQTRCFAHVADIVHGLTLLTEEPRAIGNVYNIGNPVEIPIVELARRVIERTGSDSTVELVAYDKAYDAGFEELGRRIPDPTAIRELTGWSVSRSVDEAIDDVVAYEQSRMAIGHEELRIAG